MAVLEAILAVIGLLFLILMVIGTLADKTPTPAAPEDDLAAPYREGLHAAMRMQVTAQELKQQIYAEALRRAEDDPGGKS
jgi:hypothetical protein